eukprot:m.2966 g.2966  ORF g.2966 m.2966 type:complete len:71 (+) comp8989_c0_seq2:1482-1694(+)
MYGTSLWSPYCHEVFDNRRLCASERAHSSSRVRKRHLNPFLSSAFRQTRLLQDPGRYEKCFNEGGQESLP